VVSDKGLWNELYDAALPVDAPGAWVKRAIELRLVEQLMRGLAELGGW
jgi:hypothetical protein